MSTFCPDCMGSGERSQYAILDCSADGCTAAKDRESLGAHLLALGPLSAYDREWEAYRLGQAKAAAPDLSKLARYDTTVYETDGIQPDPRGEYVMLDDVQALFAAPTNNSTESTNDR